MSKSDLEDTLAFQLDALGWLVVCLASLRGEK